MPARPSLIALLNAAAGGDEVFRHLVLARIIEPTSKADSLRVLEEAGAATVPHPALNRRLPAYAKEEWRQRLSEACAAHARLGPASLVLYDASCPTLPDAGMISDANMKAIEAQQPDKPGIKNLEST